MLDRLACSCKAMERLPEGTDAGNHAGMVQSSRGDLRTLKGVQPGTQNLRLPIDNMQP